MSEEKDHFNHSYIFFQSLRKLAFGKQPFQTQTSCNNKKEEEKKYINLDALAIQMKGISGEMQELVFTAVHGFPQLRMTSHSTKMHNLTYDNYLQTSFSQFNNLNYLSKLKLPHKQY